MTQSGFLGRMAQQTRAVQPPAERLIGALNRQAQRGHVLDSLAIQPPKALVVRTDLKNSTQPVRHRSGVLRVVRIADASRRWGVELSTILPCIAADLVTLNGDTDTTA